MRVRLTVMGSLLPRYRITSVQGRWTGKPVRIRRGPATVTGGAHRTRRMTPQATEPAARGSGKARSGSVPGARRPPSDLKPRSLVERGGSSDEAPTYRRPRGQPDRALCR